MEEVVVLARIQPIDEHEPIVPIKVHQSPSEALKPVKPPGKAAVVSLYMLQLAA
jgi:hypothetical protein